MLWFFQRNDESLKIETQFDNDKAEYVAVVRYPDGQEQAQRFSNGDEFGKWLETFEQHLVHDHWTRRPEGPVILPYGWPNKRPT